MNPFTDSLILIVNVVFNIAMLVVLLRFLLQLVRADFYNPISQAIARFTNPLLVPLRRIIPGLGGMDIASLVLLLLLEMVAIWALGFIYGAGLVPPLLVLMWAPLGVVNFFLGFYLVAIFVMIVISWVAPGTSSPVAYLLYQITEPFMAPFRKLLPSMGGLDFSPMIAVLILYISRNFVRWAGYSVNLQDLLVIGF